MTVTTLLFYVFAAILVVAAFRTVTARSPVTAAMHLILSFFTASMLWMLIHTEFLALLLVLVYVGAVMVLFLFVVMMLDINIERLSVGSRAYLPMGLVIAAIMVAEAAFVLTRTWWDPSRPLPTPAAGYNNTESIGVAMYTNYIYAIEVSAVLLLVGMVAAISLTLRRRTDVKRNSPSEQLKVRPEDRLQLLKMPAQASARRAADPANSASSGDQA